MPPSKKPKVKLPPSIWVVYQLIDGKVTEGSAACYTDDQEVGELLDDEVVAHYSLVAHKNRTTPIN